MRQRRPGPATAKILEDDPRAFGRTLSAKTVLTITLSLPFDTATLLSMQSLLLPWLARNRTAVVASTVAALSAFALTAVAVAPLANDATPVPQRWVSETVQAEGLREQLDELAQRGIVLDRSDLTRSSDTAAALLARLGVSDASAAAFIRTDPQARALLAGPAGKMVQARLDGEGQLERLLARYPSDRPELQKTHFVRLTLVRSGGRWTAQAALVAYGTQMRLASGTIRSTLFAATDEAGLPDGVSGQLTDIFSTDLDFHRQLRAGDTFSVVYEALTADGEPVAWSQGAGRVAAAEFVNAGRPHTAVWFAGADGRGAYYSVDGRSKRRSFLASPMAFSRVTSGFAMRVHPLLQSWRAHTGVDYSAPQGTPVLAVGDGKVSFAGWRSGYGNVVEIDHGGERSTLYAHLSRIDARVGQRIEQGSTLGAVGRTGWATGPHLHFEFRHAGAHQDPLRVARQAATPPLDAQARSRFQDVVRVVQARLDVAETLGRSARVE